MVRETNDRRLHDGIHSLRRFPVPVCSVKAGHFCLTDEYGILCCRLKREGTRAETKPGRRGSYGEERTRNH